MEEELSIEEFRSNNAKRCIALMCEYRKELAPHKANLEELFWIRNNILHSTDDLVPDKSSAAETAVSALRVCRKYVISHSGVPSHAFDPLTSREFQKLQKKERNTRVSNLNATLREHRKIFEGVDKPEVARRIAINRPRTDSCTWIEETMECPACGQCSLDKVGAVDFDWNPDGVLAGSGVHYQCRVCDLELSEYEHELVSSS
jgi:hypothetical protein